MKYYFAQFSPAEKGMYSIWFPDVPEAVTCGENLEDAMFMAQDCLRMALEEYAKEGRSLPEPSSLEEVRAKVAEHEKDMDVEKFGEDLYPLIAAPDIDATPVRSSVSMPRNVLAALDRKAERAGMTRSGYIASIAMA